MSKLDFLFRELASYLEEAKYDVTYKCGHSGTVDLIGKIKDRESKLSWYQNTASCPDCYKKEIEKQNEQKNRSFDLPPLKGSEKQISWGNKIRLEMIEPILKGNEAQIRMIRSSTKQDEDTKKAVIDFFNQVIEWIKNQDKASWWIDRRMKAWKDIVNEAFEFAKKHNPSSVPPILAGVKKI